MKKHRDVLNLTAWVLPDTKKQWDKHRMLESGNPDKPIGWSEWIQAKVTTALNINQKFTDTEDNSYESKAMLHNNQINLTAWVLPDIKEQWDKHRMLESGNPDKPIGWSEWIQTKVTTALNINQLPTDNGDNSYQLKAMLHNKQIEIEKLNKRLLEAENKVIGVSDDRILKILQKDRFLHFDDLVQDLINTEAENTFNTLQKLTIDGVVESDRSGNKWRLKNESY